MATSSASPPAHPTRSDSYLPDFCAGKMVLAIILIAELVAIMLALSQFQDRQSFWLTLARMSMFLMWAGLGSSALLCASRSLLARMSTASASAIAIGIVTGTTALVSAAAILLSHYFGVFLPDSLLAADGSLRFLLRNLAIAAIVAALILRYFYVGHQWRHNVELEARARIRALQARIRPHFLFNSMNTIAELTRSDPAMAESAVEDLADLFRSSLSEASHKVRLKDELEMTRIYQRIEQLRLGDRLHVTWDVNALPMRALVPALCVQPLLENAIYHGIENLPGGGTVVISGHCYAEGFDIEVRNPIPADDSRARREGNQIALDNIRQRLRLAYDKPAKVTTVVDAGEYRVTLWIPLVEAA